MPLTLLTDPKEDIDAKAVSKESAPSRVLCPVLRTQDSHWCRPELGRRIWKRRRYEIRYIQTQHDDVRFQRKSRCVAFLSRTVAQANFVRILGTVTDQTGAVLPGASVSIIDMQRGVAGEFPI